MAHLRIENLSFVYPGAREPALRNVNVDISQGQYVCICGKSGCGKTTLLRQMKPMIAPYGQRDGSIYLDGVEISGISDRDQVCRIGYVMQQPDDQIVTDKVWHELAFGLESIGMDAQLLRLRVAEMASFFGIQEWFHADVHALSGGQKQLLNLASVMVMHPDLLILDEPTSQLDPLAASSFLAAVRKVNLELGTTVIISEQRLEEIYAAADEAIVLDGGSVIASGNPREVAQKLFLADNDMSIALPCATRVYFAVEGKQAVFSADAPLTVREGRAWLSKHVKCLQPAVEEASPPQPDITADEAVSVKDVWFRYDMYERDILRGTNLSVRVGCLHAIIGCNGAGKSTLLRCICKVAKPYRGQIELFGKRLGVGRNASDKPVVMLPQDPSSLFVTDSVRAELEEMLCEGSVGQEQGARRVEEMARRCVIDHLLSRNPRDLSGGEMQRLALAKALLANPALLLLDEPTKGMDAFFKREFAMLLHGLARKGMAIVLVSHDIEFCAHYADRVSMLFDGEIVSTDTPRRFFSTCAFYTTAARRMSSEILPSAIIDKDVIAACRA